MHSEYDCQAATLELLGVPVKKKGAAEWNYFNPLGDDGKNSDFWLNVETGAYYCFSSDDKGHLTELYAEMKGMETSSAFKELKTKFPANGSGYTVPAKQTKKPPDYSYIYRKIKVTLDAQKKIVQALSKRGIVEFIAKALIVARLVKYELNSNYPEALIFPVYSAKTQQIIALQKISPDFKVKKFHGPFKTGGPGYLINQGNKEPKTLYVTESVVNAITLNTVGYTAMTVFSAKNTEFPRQFFEKYEKIIIIFDNDKDGKDGAAKLSQSVDSEKCFIFEWRKGTPEKWDVNDELQKDPLGFGTRFQEQMKNVVSAKPLAVKKEGKAPEQNANEILMKIDLEKYLFKPNDGHYQYNPAGYWEKLDQAYLEKKIKTLLSKPKRHVIAETLKMLELDTLIPQGMELNNEKWLLNLTNGVMDIKTGNMSGHKRELFSTIQLPVNFDPKATCPRFQKFLVEVLGDEKLIAILQEFVGLCLVPETKFEKCLVLVGKGANGKSTLLYVVQYLIGIANISTVAMGKLESEFHRVNLYNKLVNISSELEISELVGSGYFKSIVSGDLIDACYKFKDSLNFRPYSRLIFAMNELPRVRDRSVGFYRRLVIVPFNKQFTGGKEDKTLAKTLISEIDGIFNWALLGLNRLFEQDHFTESTIVDDMVESYKKENNPALTFIEDDCFIDLEAEVQKSNLYDAYKNYCEENGYRHLGNAQFFKEVRNQVPGISESKTGKDGNRKKILYGITLENP